MMTDKTAKHLYYSMVGLMLLLPVVQAAKMTSGPSHYEYESQAGLMFDAFVLGCATIGIMGMLLYLAKRGGLESRELRWLGKEASFWSIFIVPLLYGVTGLAWFSGYAPIYIGVAHQLLLCPMILMAVSMTLAVWPDKK